MGRPAGLSQHSIGSQWWTRATRMPAGCAAVIDRTPGEADDIRVASHRVAWLAAGQ